LQQKIDQMKIFLLLVLCALLLVSFSFSQNVGIGTTSPSEKLHVIGNIKGDTIKPNSIKLSPNAGNGKILTSDANGNASWQERSTSISSAGYGAWGDCTMNNISEYYPVGDTSAAFNDLFAHSVVMSGNYAIVGAPFDDVGSNVNQGSANIYEFDGTNWVLDQKLTDTAGAPGDQFGKSLSISGNFLIIGSNTDDVGGNVDQGSVCIYLFNGTEWEFMQKITDPAGVAGDNFGYSVSVSGNYLIVGVPYDEPGTTALNYGSACFYQFDGINWTFTQKVVHSTPSGGANFGLSVSIYGNNAIVGSPYNLGAPAVGYALFYQFNGSNWDFKIAFGIGNSSFYGTSVNIIDGYAVVGAPADFDPGYTRQTGTVYIYKLNGATWSFLQQVYDPGGEAGDNFGFSVYLSGNYLIIGTNKDKIGQNVDQGSAVIYQQAGPGWKKLQVITDPGGSAHDNFGCSTSIDGSNGRFIIGEQNYISGRGLAVFGKVNN
jgi:hypothetical protein